MDLSCGGVGEESRLLLCGIVRASWSNVGYMKGENPPWLELGPPESEKERIIALETTTVDTCKI